MLKENRLSASQFPAVENGESDKLSRDTHNDIEQKLTPNLLMVAMTVM